MTTTISGTTGVSLVQDGVIVTTDIADAQITQGKLDSLNKLLQVKAWCTFNGTTIGTNAPISGYGITNITRVSTGLYTVTFSFQMVDANYAVIATGASPAAATLRTPAVIDSTKTITNFSIGVSNGSVVVDPTLVHIIIMGN